jgi:chromosome segregation ATPase
MVSSDVAEQKPATATLPQEFERLEAAVRRLANELAGYQARAQVAEKRAAELERTLKDVSTGDLDPLSLRDRIRKLEQENRELRGRMLKAQDRIRRLLARFDFLREDM